MTWQMSAHTIELKLHTIQQLFNSMDPSPFHERDLDKDAETFIESWAQECPRATDIRIVMHLTQPPDETTEKIADSIHNYFEYKEELNRNDLRRLMREGWASLLIGIVFLVACSMAGRAIAHRPGESLRVLSEGITIIGWVAMWRPLEIYLYRWWPIRHLGKTFRKLSAAEVEVRTATNRTS